HSDVLQDEPCHVSVPRREFSLITVDRPTSTTADDQSSFYSRVVRPLVSLPREADNLYGWLTVMFAFCHDKPFVCYSRYVPSPDIHDLARSYGVDVVHCPLDWLPQPLLDGIA